MLVRNNYNECLTNLACSIRKYFELDYKHNTLEYIDKILEEKKPKNVICILFDGMGSNILEKTLDKNSFFIKNKISDLTTVFPATTTAATTSMRTGLNPCEHGWLGWNTYIEPINKTITLFRDSEMDSEEICEEFLKVKDLLVTKTIVDEINNIGKYNAIELFPFGENMYCGIDEMISRIKNEANKDGKKFIYAYDDEPDGSMHEFGCDSEVAKELINIRNSKIQKLCDELDDSIIIVVADHGHLNCKYMFFDDYPELINMFERLPSLEQRTLSFKIKSQYLSEFKSKFLEIYGKYFSLYDKDEVIKCNLFGDGKFNNLFAPAIGDYIAIAEDNNICLTFKNGTIFKSNHAGYSDDEIYIPLIVIDKCS